LSVIEGYAKAMDSKAASALKSLSLKGFIEELKLRTVTLELSFKGKETWSCSKSRKSELIVDDCSELETILKESCV